MPRGIIQSIESRDTWRSTVRVLRALCIKKYYEISRMRRKNIDDNRLLYVNDLFGMNWIFV